MNYVLSPKVATITALMVSFLLISFAIVRQSEAQQQGGVCGKNTLTFGCHAYIYGNSGSAASYAGRADSVFVDAQYMAQNTALAQRLNQTGPVPFFYTNAYCEKRFGGCGGPQLSGSSVAAQYGEIAQHPNSAEFFNNFNKQLGWVKQAQGKVIEIDNMDFYIEKGHKAAIVKLIQLAANAGLNVLSKNVRDRDILALPNVVGAVVEEGSGNAQDYHSVFAAVGKSCAGVLMINARSKAGNQYTSFTECDHPNRGSKSEYTKCSCTKNAAGMQIAGTPVAGPNVDIPQGTQQQIYNTQPQSNPYTQAPLSQSSTSSPPTAQNSASQPQAQPQYAYQQPPPQQMPSSALGQRETAVKDKSVATQSSVTDSDQKKSPLNAKEQERGLQFESDETEFYDPLGGTKKKNAALSKKSDTVIPKPFGDARMRCMPTTMLPGTRPTLAWSCGRDATRSVGVGFDTRNFLLGSERVSPFRTTLFAIKCYDEDMLIGSAQCIIKVHSDKGAEESFKAPIPGSYDASTRKKVCFLSFCL